MVIVRLSHYPRSAQVWHEYYNGSLAWNEGRCLGITTWGLPCNNRHIDRDTEFCPMHDRVEYHRVLALYDPPPLPPDPARVYFIYGAGMVKIGISIDVEKRFRDLQNQSPVKLTLLGSEEGGRWKESRLHKIYNRERSHGEWFNLSPRLKRRIKKRYGVQVDKLWVIDPRV